MLWEGERGLLSANKWDAQLEQELEYVKGMMLVEVLVLLMDKGLDQWLAPELGLMLA